MTSQKNTVVRNTKIAWQKIQEKVVLVSPQTMRIHVIHGSGGSIWGYLEKQRSVNDLAELLCEEYDTTTSNAKKDVVKFLDVLKKEGLVLTGGHA